MNKKILRLAVPNIITNLAVPLLSSVDTALVGHLDAVYYIGAVSIGSMIFNFVYWGFGFLRMGTTGMAAQALGGEDHGEALHILLRALAVALIGAFLLIIGQRLIENLSFYLVGATPEVEQFARSYFRIRIWAAPATLGLYAFTGWFLGMQNARYPLYITIAANLANVAMDVWFVTYTGLKSDGVAWGTVAAQYLGLILALLFFLQKYRPYLAHYRRASLLEIKKIKAFFSLNGDIFIRTISLIFVFSFFTAKSAELGDDLLAANTVLMQLWMIFSFGIDGFAFAAESLVGRAIGAGDRKFLHKIIRLIFLWGSGLGLVFVLIYAVGAKPILHLFTNQDALVSLCLSYMGWTIAAPFVNSFCYIWDGIYIGATASKAMRNTMLFSTFVVFFPLFYLGRYLWGNHGIWAAMLVFMAMRWLTMQLLAKKHIYAKAATVNNAK